MFPHVPRWFSEAPRLEKYDLNNSKIIYSSYLHQVSNKFRIHCLHKKYRLINCGICKWGFVRTIYFNSPLFILVWKCQEDFFLPSNILPKNRLPHAMVTDRSASSLIFHPSLHPESRSYSSSTSTSGNHAKVKEMPKNQTCLSACQRPATADRTT